MSNEIDGEDLNPILDAIDAAEDIPDPLDGLVEKSAEDPGAAFTPEVLERLVALKSEDRAAFEAWRAKLKKAGIPNDYKGKYELWLMRRQEADRKTEAVGAHAIREEVDSEDSDSELGDGDAACAAVFKPVTKGVNCVAACSKT